jgi:hypothetical protein
LDRQQDRQAVADQQDAQHDAKVAEVGQRIWTSILFYTARSIHGREILGLSLKFFMLHFGTIGGGNAR